MLVSGLVSITEFDIEKFLLFLEQVACYSKDKDLALLSKDN